MYSGPATIDAVLARRTTERPDHPVVRFNGDSGVHDVTYADLAERSGRFARALGALGLASGDTAAIMLPNGPAFLTAWFGMARAGVVEVPINTAYRGDLLTYVLAQSRCRLLVVDADLLPRVSAIAEDLPDLAHVLIVGDVDLDAANAALPDRQHVAIFAEVVAAYEPNPLGGPLRPTDRSVVLYTSGTTGPSKGVVLSHNANFRLARTMSAAAGFRRDEVLITAFPLFHVAARYVSALAAMLIDGRVVINERFSSSRFWEECREERVTAIHYLGSLLTMLLKRPPSEAERDNAVEIAYGAGAPLPVWEEVERRFGLRLFELYGMTETGAVTMNRSGAYRAGSCGQVLEDCEVAVHDEHDRPMPTGETGEVVVRPREPNIMIEEYLAMPEATLAAFRNLWFHTGDRGYFDEDGFLYFVGRQKDAIRRRGENVSAFEVETVLADDERVEAVAVVGVDDEISGEEILAVIVRKDPDLEAESLLDVAQDRLPYFAVPRYVRFVDELPMTPSQRVEKYKLRNDGLTDDTWDREAAGYEIRR